MSDKLVALLAVAAVPACSVCILGPAVVSGFLAGWFGWLADFDAGLVIVLAGLAVITVLGYLKYRRTPQPKPAAPISERQP